MNDPILFAGVKSPNAFRMSIRAAIRGYWSGNFSRAQFDDDMRNTINRRLNEAFEKIAHEFNISRDEFTTEENRWIGTFVASQISEISGLADDIDSNSKANGGKLREVMSRAIMWSDRYSEVESRARAMFGGNEKLIWDVGATEHCSSCLRLNGTVKRASVWETAAGRGIYPKSKALACGGYRCQCRLRSTTQAVSKGRIPGV